MEQDGQEILARISSAGTISIPKQYRKYMGMQKGDYVRIALDGDRLVVRKATIT